MTATKLKFQTLIGTDGKPTAAFIPWRGFGDLKIDVDGEHPTPAEWIGILAAKADRDAGNTAAFVFLDELEAELFD